MTVSTTTNQSGPFTCNGTVDAFDYTFQVDATTDIVVTLTNTSTGVNTVVNPSLVHCCGGGDRRHGNVWDSPNVWADPNN